MERRLLRNVDWTLVTLAAVLVGIGLVIIASATQAHWNDPGSLSFVKRQLVWLLAGFAAMVVFAAIDYHSWASWSTVLYVVNLMLLAVVLVAGAERLGASRWIVLGPFQLQPSEFAKIALILTLAAHLHTSEGQAGWRQMISSGLHVVPPMVLIMLQPDLGTSLVFVVILFMVWYAAGLPGWRIAVLGAAGLGAAVLWIFAHFHYGIKIPLHDYQLKRLIVFLNPGADPTGAGYHIIQSKIAIGSGQLYGQGLFNGALNRYSYLPENQTDFIFAVVGEELGFLGAVVLLLLFFLLLRRGLVIAREARDPLGFLIATGVVAMMAAHVLINVGMTIGVMPVTGVPLPFISYGGSSLIANFAAIGLLLSVGMRRHKILF